MILRPWTNNESDSISNSKLNKNQTNRKRVLEDFGLLSLAVDFNFAANLSTQKTKTANRIKDLLLSEDMMFEHLEHNEQDEGWRDYKPYYNLTELDQIAHGYGLSIDPKVYGSGISIIDGKRFLWFLKSISKEEIETNELIGSVLSRIPMELDELYFRDLEQVLENEWWSNQISGFDKFDELSRYWESIEGEFVRLGYEKEVDHIYFPNFLEAYQQWFLKEYLALDVLLYGKVRPRQHLSVGLNKEYMLYELGAHLNFIDKSKHENILTGLKARVEQIKQNPKAIPFGKEVVKSVMYYLWIKLTDEERQEELKKVWEDFIYQWLKNLSNLQLSLIDRTEENHLTKD